ncbi:hypothetical protein IDJ77_15590 [Mucilaginibacter sp. ZT4R22]|uniref:Outer membrane protein with beta-barrel domain n=1 Tax=Mucilaginibacter pankratovii TaxID=2772110 RepID=A0ABR7WSS1_9SPHI|nr:hypothetical protein [Mucilaginibacter pankratovii]MBD1365238.1 hypothetical protein [Mucilaginibacter pankratovii]
MIKFLRPAVIALITIASLSANAQKLSKADSLNNVYANKKAQNVYFEVLGPGAVYSFNYDTRFKNRQDGLGGRAGISYYAESGDRILTIPIVFNYLLGKNGKYFEVGAGATFYHYNSDSHSDFFGDRYYDYTEYPTDYYPQSQRHTENGVYGSLNFGYRYQPIDGGFTFRGGFSPIFSSHQLIPYWPYLSFGYSF